MMPQVPMMPYPGTFGMQSPMPTQPVMPTQASPYNPYMPQAAQPVKAPEFDWIRVNSMDDAKNVSVPPGQKAWIMLQNDPIFVVKSANDMGLATTQAFKFEPYNMLSELNRRFDEQNVMLKQILEVLTHEDHQNDGRADQG